MPYREVESDNYTTLNQCLACKSQISGNGRDWRMCPVCGAEWVQVLARPHAIPRWAWERWGKPAAEATLVAGSNKYGDPATMYVALQEGETACWDERTKRDWATWQGRIKVLPELRFWIEWRIVGHDKWTAECNSQMHQHLAWTIWCERTRERERSPWAIDYRMLCKDRVVLERRVEACENWEG